MTDKTKKAAACVVGGMGPTALSFVPAEITEAEVASFAGGDAAR